MRGDLYDRLCALARRYGVPLEYVIWVALEHFLAQQERLEARNQDRFAGKLEALSGSAGADRAMAVARSLSGLRLPTVGEVCWLHEELCRRMNWDPTLRELAALELVLVLLYREAEGLRRGSKKEHLARCGARLLFELVHYRPFQQGNVALAWMALLHLLNTNGFQVRASSEAIYRMLRNIEAGDPERIYRWLLRHMRLIGPIAESAADA